MHKFDDSLPLQLLKAREAALSFFRPCLLDNALTEQQWRVLQALEKYKELESKALADHCCILSPSLTGILNRLEQQGFIQRRKSDEDKRRILISLTEKSNALLHRLTPEFEARYQAFTERYDEEKLQQLVSMLEELAEMEA